MSTKMRSDLFKIFTHQTLAPFDSAACLTGEGEILDLKYETLADIGTLGTAASTVTRYFPLRLGDVVILNDPYSGGTTLSMVTLVTPLLMNHPQIPNLFLAVRTGFRHHLMNSKTLDEEGLRIPPTPIAQNRQLNDMILQAITSHPFCPKGLAERIKSTLELIWKRVDCFQGLLLKDSQFCNRVAIKDFLRSSRQQFSELLQELPSGESKVEFRMDSGELIRLRLELSGESILFDFAGTSSSKRLCLTDSATFGVCFGAVSAFLQKSIPLNSGSFSLLHVTTPLGSLLNSKYPSPTFRGMSEGTGQVAGLVLQALGEIVPHKKFSSSAQTPTQISFEFANGQLFFDSLPGGIGASPSSEGADAIHFWQRNYLRNSVQEIESLFPLLINQISIRKNSGGGGHHRGGHGLIKEYIVQEDAKLRWIILNRKNPPKGLKGGKDGEPPEIHVEHTASGKRDPVFDDEGELQVKKGDKITVASAGGGGYGINTK
jgi:N-methylhydantoinase B